MTQVSFSVFQQENGGLSIHRESTPQKSNRPFKFENGLLTLTDDAEIVEMRGYLKMPQIACLVQEIDIEAARQRALKALQAMTPVAQKGPTTTLDFQALKAAGDYQVLKAQLIEQGASEEDAEKMVAEMRGNVPEKEQEGNEKPSEEEVAQMLAAETSQQKSAKLVLGGK